MAVYSLAFEEIKDRVVGINFKPFILFFLLTLFVGWANYPVGVYDLGGDHWIYANRIAGFMNKYDFSHDVYMYDKSSYIFFTSGIIQSPFVKLVGSYERYIAYLNLFLFFSGTSLLYIVCYLLTRSNLISFFSSCFFSFSLIEFPSTQDFFGLVPLWSADSRTIAYVYYLILLFLLLSLKITPIRLYVLVFMATGMVWIHELTFMGPGIAFITVCCLLIIISKDYSKKQKIIVNVICALVFLAFLLPYIILFIKSFGFDPSASFSEEVKELQKNLLKWYKINPFFLPNYIFELTGLVSGGLRGYAYLLTLSLISIFFIKVRNIKLIWCITLFCILINTILHGFDHFIGYKFHLYCLARNSKWLFFNLFLILLASYPDLRNIVAKSSIKYSVVLLNTIFLLLLFVIFAPHIKQSITGNSISRKIAEKTGACEYFRSRNKIPIITNRVLKFCPDNDRISILKINKDVEDISSFILNIPRERTFSGPSWLRYKAGRNMAYTTINGGDGRRFLQKGDMKFLEWHRQDQVYKNLMSKLSSNNIKTSDVVTEICSIGGHYLFIEKFQIDYLEDKKIYIYKKKNIILDNLPIAYENDSFVVIDLQACDSVSGNISN